MNVPVWRVKQTASAKLNSEMHRAAMRWRTDQQLREAYELYRSKLALDAEGWPPNAAAVQYFVTAWRELRRRMRAGTPRASA